MASSGAATVVAPLQRVGRELADLLAEGGDVRAVEARLGEVARLLVAQPESVQLALERGRLLETLLGVARSLHRRVPALALFALEFIVRLAGVLGQEAARGRCGTAAS